MTYAILAQPNMITPQPIRTFLFIHLDASDWNTHADGDLHTEQDQ